MIVLALGLMAIFFGFTTTHTDFQDPPRRSIDLMIYGHYIGSDESNPPYPALGHFAFSGAYKFYLMAAALGAGIGGVVIFRTRP